MIVEPKVKGFICTTAHPAGCKESVRRQIAYCKEKGMVEGPKKVLVIGSSTGYGLASRIAVTYGYGADTIGVAFERESNGRRTATAGWYNTKAFEEFAKEDGYYAKSFNGDGFSEEMKNQVIETIRKDFGKVDMVVYSMAAPRRTLPDGTTVSSFGYYTVEESRKQFREKGNKFGKTDFCNGNGSFGFAECVA